MHVSAYANDSVVLLSWLPDAKIPDCLGYAVTMILEDGTRKVLQTYVPFEGQTNDNWQPHPSTEWPIQKCQWMDFSAPYGKPVRYEITPVTGTPDNLKVRTELSATTEAVTLSMKITDEISAAFTRGILSTQWLAHNLPVGADGLPDFETLLKAIQEPGNPIRKHLMGNVIALMKEQILKAKAEGGKAHVYQLFYELTDPEWVAFLMENLQWFSLILSKAGKDDITNAATRKKFHEAGADISDRMLPDTSLGHNKSQTRVDKNEKPVGFQGGSANATYTGFCCQSNNVISIESPGLATLTKEYWDLVKADGSESGAALRTWCGKRKQDIVLKDGTKITAWFSPNMADKTKPSKNAPTPPDMAELFGYMDGAKQGIFFLAFFPGWPSIISKIASMNNSRDDLILRGAVSSVDALPKTRLFHRRGELPTIVAASGIEQQFAAWQKELLKLPDAHAIIHDKLMVIDPWSETDCIVVITSHNLGYKASYANDENMLIIRGNRRLVMAYLVHILDVYNHYRFRAAVHLGKSGFQGFLSKSADWQDKYLVGPARKELEYFTGTHILKAA
jgi:hypothetical protein